MKNIDQLKVEAASMTDEELIHQFKEQSGDAKVILACEISERFVNGSLEESEIIEYALEYDISKIRG